MASEAAPAGEVDKKKKGTPKGGKKPKPTATTVAKSGNQDGIQTKKNDDFAGWYSEVITKAELLEYYTDVSGCYILRPNGMYIWNRIKKFITDDIESRGVDECYFPMFVTKDRLEKEAAHVEGFSAEVAWVTKSGNTDLETPIAIRPTSETIMYPSFAKWIRSHRDLPLRVNQWCPIVRWEFKQPTPFIRTREFLWQEGHTAHATAKEAEDEMYAALELYRRTYEELLAVPCQMGLKSIKERFAGGVDTSTVEVFVAANGRAIQAATSHNLGTNFSKMFGIDFEKEDKEKQNVFQTSWGLTTRAVGCMIMVHGDDKGLVVPPRVAKQQVVIMPIRFKGGLEPQTKACHVVAEELRSLGVRVQVDDSEQHNPGWKFAHHEVRGVPLRIEIGPKDLEKESVMTVRRDTGVKNPISLESLKTAIPALLEEIQNDMYQRAKLEREARICKVQDDFKVNIMEKLNSGNLVMLPWVDSPEVEEEIKKWSAECSQQMFNEGKSKHTGGMKSLCSPLNQEEEPGLKCFWTGKEGARWWLFGRSY